MDMKMKKSFYIQFGDETLQQTLSYHGDTSSWKTIEDVIESAEFEARDAGLLNHPYVILNEKKEVVHRGVANSSNQTN
jgi:hypothetical protein